MNELIERLPEQVPLDIIGDIHGEKTVNLFRFS